MKEASSEHIQQLLQSNINKAQVQAQQLNSEYGQDEYRLEMDKLRNQAEIQSKKRKLNADSGKFAGLNPSVALLMMDNSDVEGSRNDSTSSDNSSSSDESNASSDKKERKKKSSKSSKDKSDKRDRKKKRKKEKKERKEKKEKKRKDSKREKSDS